MSYEAKARSYKPMVITPENAISTGRFLSRLEFRKTEKSKYFIVEVTDNDGGTARKIYYEPKMMGFTDTEEKLTKEVGKFTNVIESLVKAVLPDDYSTGKIESFEDFCTKVQRDVPAESFSKELRVKCIYDKNGNPTLPSFGVVFEDPKKVTEEKTRIKIFDRDRLEKVAMDEDASPKLTTDDLPFDL